MMKTQQFLQASLNEWRAIPLGWGWLSLSFLFVATLVLYAAHQNAPVLIGAGATAGEQSDAAILGVLNYVRVHESVPERAMPLDPAVQSVNDYLRVHAAVSEQPAALDGAAVRGVADYLRAHSTVSLGAQTDPAIQSVLNYIRVHDTVPDQVILELYGAHADHRD